ncbi:unnamed protein product [Larinioides sclopetarius]|uniref:Speckle-type POZ protein n=1 Tax=Larinioides sclopetarius TaxID=280406 RepID=A0AAV2BXA4_9ARAC
MAKKEGKVLKFIWKIENYSYCWKKTADFLQSPEFQIDIFEGSSWCLKLYPRGVSLYENYISVHLGRLNSSRGPLGITVDYEIALIGSDGTAVYVKETKGQCFRKGRAFGFDNLAVRREIFGEKKSALLPEDILTVQCRIFPKGTELKKHIEIIAKTHIELERTVFSWKLQNNIFNKNYESNRLNVSNAERNTFLKIFWLEGYMTLRFFFGHFPTIKVIRCRIGILDSNDSVSWILVDKQIITSEIIDVKLLRADEILKQESLYLPNNKLTLHCDFTFSFGVQHSKIEIVSYENALSFITTKRKVSTKIETSPKSHPCCCSDNYASFRSDFQNLYQEGTLCDFTLKVGNDKIQAHKVVLGARSPVFKAMLTSNMKENVKNMVDISDMDVSTVLRMLTFMYTDETGDLDWDTASKLYFAADKYGIMKLKRICSSVLVRNLRVSNVGEALSLAHLHGDEDLKNLTLEFISRHDTEVICSTEWKAFMTKEVHLAAETMRYIFIKKAENNKG